MMFILKTLLLPYGEREESVDGCQAESIWKFGVLQMTDLSNYVASILT